MAFSKLSMAENTSNSVTLRYELSYGLVCLLKTRPTVTTAKICTREAVRPVIGCNVGDTRCVPVDLPHDYRQVGGSFIGTWDSPLLSGDTPYLFTAFVSYGNLTRCLSMELRTPEGIPSGVPTDVSFGVNKNSGSSTFTLTWLPPSRPERNGNISHYRILFWDPEDGSGVGSRETMVNDSLQFVEKYDSTQNYFYAVAACTSTGCGPSYNGSYDPNSSRSGVTSKGMHFSPVSIN